MRQIIAEKMLCWYDQHKRSLPFRGSRDPYRVWVSEIMLQQTRTETVSAYFTRFIARFPDVFALAEAEEEDVLKLWEGLGYYSRARNLHKAAKIIARENQGVFPRDVSSLRVLPGVGDYTAAAVASIAFDTPVPAMDGNLTRVFSRLFGVREDVGMPSVKRLLFEKAKEEMPPARSGDLNQALMDLGAGVCLPGTPDCEKCPLSTLCDAYAAGDADLLPIKSAAAPPREINMAVVLVTCRGRALLVKREEALLKNLWVFPLLEDACGKSDREKGLKKLGVRAAYRSGLGHARHVFTHRVWQMELFHYAAEEMESSAGQWLTLREINEKPLPTAMRAAKTEITRLLTPNIMEADKSMLPALAAVYAESWQHTHREHCTEAFLAAHHPAFMEETLQAHQAAGRKVYALSIAGEIAGVLVLDKKRNELVSLYIGPKYQGIGLGRQAASFAVQTLDQKKEMRVTVLKENVRAVSLYRSLGFTRIQEEKLLDPDFHLIEMDLVRRPENA